MGTLASFILALVHTKTWAALVVRGSYAWVTVSYHMHASLFSWSLFPGGKYFHEHISLNRERHLMVYLTLQQDPYLHHLMLWQWAGSSSHSQGLVGVDVLPCWQFCDTHAHTLLLFLLEKSDREAGWCRRGSWALLWGRKLEWLRAPCQWSWASQFHSLRPCFLMSHTGIRNPRKPANLKVCI